MQLSSTIVDFIATAHKRIYLFITGKATVQTISRKCIKPVTNTTLFDEEMIENIFYIIYVVS